MKIGYVHILPIEYYPPAVNTIRHLASREDVELTVWSSANDKERPEFTCSRVEIQRPRYVIPSNNAAKRLLDSITWNWACARGLKRAKVDAVIYIEPHSALAIWMYYHLLGGQARLFIHHHEYYAPGDYDRPGMRLVKWAHAAERKALFNRAEWISQTNDNRLQFFQKDNPAIDGEKLHSWPNFPPISWRIKRSNHPQNKRLKLLYLGSASFHDTYIREVAEWAAHFPEQLSLTISGFNVDQAVWDWLDKRNFSNVITNPQGWDYEALPEQLSKYDIGLILYKGNTTNFIYNAPNKLFEYWAAGLEVWFPKEMIQISEMKANRPDLPLVELDYTRLGPEITHFKLKAQKVNFPTDYSCEQATSPLISKLFNG
ncbi:hypothetical protein [Cerasicoccus maritimus]|uniref:hypothetical protein n=1 Tax=Cerasicoccus maritimus TaxID=490089 RepID=UPI002852CB27|nr:hypothetical protein [Cerasicoccus maritimus]